MFRNEQSVGYVEMTRNDESKRLICRVLDAMIAILMKVKAETIISKGNEILKKEKYSSKKPSLAWFLQTSRSRGKSPGGSFYRSTVLQVGIL